MCLIPNTLYSLCHEACVDTCSLQPYSPSNLRNSKTHLFSFLQPFSPPLGGNEWQEQGIQSFLHTPECLLLVASISQMNAVENALAVSREFQVLSSCFPGKTNRQKVSFLQQDTRNWLARGLVGPLVVICRKSQPDGHFWENQPGVWRQKKGSLRTLT